MCLYIYILPGGELCSIRNNGYEEILNIANGDFSNFDSLKIC